MWQQKMLCYRVYVSVAGQFVCGSKKCAEKEGLRSWEVNFAYIEQGEKKNALVKLRKSHWKSVFYAFHCPCPCELIKISHCFCFRMSCQQHPH